MRAHGTPTSALAIAPALAAVLAAPAVVATLAALAVATCARAGFDPLSGGTPANAAEAAIRGDLPSLAAFDVSGFESRRRYELRETRTTRRVRVATPLEAAVVSRQIRVVRYLLSRSVPLGEADRQALVCLARDVGASDIETFLRSNGSDPPCVAGAALAALR